jgi:diguanylate cyclase (GGDEF)-like protein
VAERIRQRVATRPIRLGEADITTSVSIGIAASPEHGSAFDTLVKNADRALYVSKSRGRNCVVVFPDGTPAPA